MSGKGNDFDFSFKYVMINEGGAKYTNHKHDKGSHTKYGITISTLSRWRREACSPNDVKELTEEEAKEIYWGLYWLPLNLPAVDSRAISTAMFDIGVVRGIGVPPKYAQEICNKFGFKLKIDGHIGPKTLQALNEIDEQTFVYGFSHRAENGFKAIAQKNPTQNKFLKGWLNRAKKLRGLV